jgi:hypothetical protein
MDKYWDKIAEDIYAYRYYKNYNNHLKNVRKYVCTFVALICFIIINFATNTSSRLGTALLLLSGLAALIYDQTQINDRLYALKYMLPIAKERSEAMQEDWRAFKRGEYSEKDFIAIVEAHDHFTTNLSKTYLENVRFPSHKKSSERASIETEIIVDRFC